MPGGKTLRGVVIDTSLGHVSTRHGLKQVGQTQNKLNQEHDLQSLHESWQEGTQ